MEIIFYRYGSICDILGCGGFLMTNFQSELTDYFTIGVDLEAYSSMDELVDKCAYDLAHDEEWKQIAKNGYEKVPAQPYLSPQDPENAESTDTYRLRYTSF